MWKRTGVGGVGRAVGSFVEFAGRGGEVLLEDLFGF